MKGYTIHISDKIAAEYLKENLKKIRFLFQDGYLSIISSTVMSFLSPPSLQPLELSTGAVADPEVNGGR